MFKKILLATDGSEYASRAAEKAIELAKYNPSSSIEVVYVVDGERSKTDVLHNWNSVGINEKRKEKLAFIEQKAKRNGIACEINILHGEPGPTVVKHANEYDFDLVVIGSRGLNKLQEMVLGSVSHKVAKRVKCPVLIIK